VTPPPQYRPNLELLDDLREAVAARPRWRLHVHPDAAMWISIGVGNTGMSEHVRVVPDNDCPEAGKGWIETVTAERWRELQALTGQPVTVTTATLGPLTGTLLALDDTEARLDVGGGDLRYLPWISVIPAYTSPPPTERAHHR
jgi:hypothetical protein